MVMRVGAEIELLENVTLKKKAILEQSGEVTEGEQGAVSGDAVAAVAEALRAESLRTDLTNASLGTENAGKTVVVGSDGGLSFKDTVSDVTILGASIVSDHVARIPIAGDIPGIVSTGFTEIDRDYALKVSGSRGYVTVPWVNTEYTAGHGLDLDDNVFKAALPLYPVSAVLNGSVLEIDAPSVPDTTGVMLLVLLTDNVPAGPVSISLNGGDPVQVRSRVAGLENDLPNGVNVLLYRAANNWSLVDTGWSDDKVSIYKTNISSPVPITLSPQVFSASDSVHGELIGVNTVYVTPDTGAIHAQEIYRDTEVNGQTVSHPMMDLTSEQTVPGHKTFNDAHAVSLTGGTIDAETLLSDGEPVMDLTSPQTVTGHKTFSDVHADHLTGDLIDAVNLLRNGQPVMDLTSPQTVTGDKRFIGTLTVEGEIYLNGESYIIKAETIESKNSYIYLRQGATRGLPDGEYSGFQVRMYDGVQDGRLIIDNTGTARVGDVGDERPLTTREGTFVTGHTVKWNNSTLSIEDAGYELTSVQHPNFRVYGSSPYDNDNTTV